MAGSLTSNWPRPFCSSRSLCRNLFYAGCLYAGWPARCPVTYVIAIQDVEPNWHQQHSAADGGAQQAASARRGQTHEDPRPRPRQLCKYSYSCTVRFDKLVLRSSRCLLADCSSKREPKESGEATYKSRQPRCQVRQAGDDGPMRQLYRAVSFLRNCSYQVPRASL